MNSRVVRTLLLTAAVLWVPRAAAAQIPAGCSSSYERLATITEQVRPGHFRLREKAEVTCDNHKFFADHVDFYTDEDRLVASGNVLLVTPDTRITATRVEFDLKAKTGVFYDASGMSRVKPAVGTKSMYGTQEADMYFRGEKLEKLGEKKYRLTNGGFTTCLQPTARWEFTSGTVTINVDRYAVAKNTVFRVKGVPLLYLPIIYYPLDEDNRSTGFLLPSYGNSYIHGQTIRNAFFWAINRSVDFTVMHDWFSKTGQAAGAELRYAAAPGSSGSITATLIQEKASTTTYPDGRSVQRAGGRNYQIDGTLAQQLPGNFRAGAQIRYFSDLVADALYNYNPLDYSSRQSTINGNVSGQIAGLQVGAAYNRVEYFSLNSSSSITGTAPRVTVSRAEQTLGRLPIYWGFSADGTGILFKTIRGDEVIDRGRTRIDVTPTVRVPLSRLPWLNVAASATWHETWWSRSMDPVTREVVDEPLSRRYMEMQATATGPTFSRVFNTPGLRYAQRWKHVIEPTATISRTTAIGVRDRILSDYDTSDFTVGGVTRLNYALTNRLYARRGEGAAGTVREIASLTFTQSYYADAKLAADDQVARNPSLLYLPVSNFTPLAIAARVTPVDQVSLDFRTDYERITNTFRQLSAGATARIGSNVDINGSWSKTRQPKDSPYADSVYYNSHSLNGAFSLRTDRNTYGGTYRLIYDLQNTAFINQSVTAYYNPQCCGFAIEYFRANLPGFVGGGVYDRRFNVSFTLAGIGTFSDFFGALGADPYRR